MGFCLYLLPSSSFIFIALGEGEWTEYVCELHKTPPWSWLDGPVAMDSDLPLPKAGTLPA